MRTDPYAPPAARGPSSAVPSDASLDVARERLRAYLARPSEWEQDAARARRFPKRTLVMGAILGVLLVVLLALVDVRLALPMLFFPVLIGLVSVPFLRMPRRFQPTEPDRALIGYLSSIQLGRLDYHLACLAPTARERTVQVPDVFPVVRVPGEHRLDRAESIQQYLGSFARPNRAHMRVFTIKHVQVERSKDDVATVSAHVKIVSVPMIAQVVITLSLVFAA